MPPSPPSADRRLRTESLDALRAFLAGRRAVSAADARRLWTGLFYALWMTDRPRPQQALAAALADLVFELRPRRGGGDDDDEAAAAESVGAWLRAFWAVLSAQWPRIDRLRLDKFLLLARRGLAAHVRYARERAAWRPRPGAADDVVAVLADAVFDACEAGAARPYGAGVALGLRLHALDVWVDELVREGALAVPASPPSSPAAAAADAGSADDSPEDPDDAAARAAFVARLGTVVEALRTSCPVRSVRARARESYADPRLPWAAAAAAAADDDDDDVPDAPDEDGDDGDGWGGIED